MYSNIGGVKLTELLCSSWDSSLLKYNGEIFLDEIVFCMISH